MPYFRIAGCVLLFISAFHLTGHLFRIPNYSTSAWFSTNETEKRLLELMTGYHKNIGGKSISMMDIHNGLSLCYSLFFLWLGLLTLLMYKPIRRNHRLLARISFLNSILLAIGIIFSQVYFFWVPLASFSLACVLFLLAGITFSRSRQF